MNEDSILEAIRLQSERPPEERLGDEYNEMVKGFVIDRNTEYPDPEYLIEFGGAPSVPKGNLVAVSAKWKNGKTFFCDILAAVFLGSDHFAGCRGLTDKGRVLFYDTEQAESDTARIRKTIDAMIPEHRHDDIRVFCLRDAPIDRDDRGGKPSRFELIKSGIEHEHPDLVIVDGIADLIYNYNDVVESQDVVNELAALANRHNCAIVVVMHQNKGAKDRNMKGHLGTMLNQKGSDEFSVEKHGTLFVVSHVMSRHRQGDGLVFKLDANAVPMDAAADRQRQKELEHQQAVAKMRDQLALCMEDGADEIKKSELAKLIIEKLGYSQAQAYNIIKEAEKLNVLIYNDKRHCRLVPLQQ